MAMLCKNRGLNDQRLSREPLEQLFAEEWDKINKREHGRTPTLPHLLDPLNQHCPNAVLNEDYQKVATIIQWLGSPCGQGFIEDVIQKARDKKIPMRIKTIGE